MDGRARVVVRMMSAVQPHQTDALARVVVVQVMRVLSIRVGARKTRCYGTAQHS